MRPFREWYRWAAGLLGSARPLVPDVKEMTMDHAQPQLPAMAVLADGRFALRIAVRTLDGSLLVWEVRRRRVTATDEDPSPATGWLVDEYLDDAGVVAAGARSVESLIDMSVLADEFEAAGQFAAARIARERATLVRHAGAGS